MFNIDKQMFWNAFASIGLSTNIMSLIDAMLHPDPALRPTTADILAHPWMTQ